MSSKNCRSIIPRKINPNNEYKAYYDRCLCIEICFESIYKLCVKR